MHAANAHRFRRNLTQEDMAYLYIILLPNQYSSSWSLCTRFLFTAAFIAPNFSLKFFKKSKLTTPRLHSFFTTFTLGESFNALDKLAIILALFLLFDCAQPQCWAEIYTIKGTDSNVILVYIILYFASLKYARTCFFESFDTHELFYYAFFHNFALYNIRWLTFFFMDKKIKSNPVI